MAPPSKKAKAAAAGVGQASMSSFFSKAKSKDELANPMPTHEPSKSPPSLAPLHASTSQESAPTPMPVAPIADLPDDVQKRIEENRRRALERRDALKKAAEDATSPTKTSDASAAEHAESPAKTLDTGARNEHASSASLASEALATSSAQLAKEEGGDPSSTEASPTTAPVAPSTHSFFAPRLAPQPKEKVIASPEKLPLPSVLQKSPAPHSTAHFAGEKTSAARKEAMLLETSDRFMTGTDKASWMQYNSVYLLRLAQLRDPVLEQASKLWLESVPPGSFVQDMTALSLRKGLPAVAAGVLFREMRARPNVVEMYRDHRAVMSGGGLLDDPEKVFHSQDDRFWLEGRSLRLQLELPEKGVDAFVTGLVVAVMGDLTDAGTLRVKAWCFPVPALAPPALSTLKTTSRESLPNAPYIALTSGLHFGCGTADAERHNDVRRRLVDLIAGRFNQHESIGSAICRLIVCGGTVALEAQTKEATTAALVDADAFYAELAALIPVDVMPGRGDPSTSALPQEALHPYLFRLARRCQDFRSVSNPYEVGIEGVRVLGHSGQPVKDMLRCSNASSPLEALKLCLEARHLAPTAPDTLPTKPFTDADPFVIDVAPHLLFSGGHDIEEHCFYQTTQCVCVPALSRQAIVVVVSLRDPGDVRSINLDA